MDAHVARLTDRLAVPLLRQTTFIAGMACFMGCRHEAVEKICLTEPGGDPLVPTAAGAERMGADIYPPLVKIKTEALHQFPAQLLLQIDGIMAGNLRADIASLFLDNLLHQAWQNVFEPGKNRRDKAAAVPGTV